MLSSHQKILLISIKVLIAAVFFVLLLVKTDMIFPYVAFKAIVFRTLVGLAFVGYLILAWQRPDYRPNFKNPLIISVSVFAVSMIVSAFVGIDLVKSLWGDIERSEGVFQYLHYYVYFLIVASVLKERKDFELMMKIFLGVAVIIAWYGWGQYFGWKGFTLTGGKLERIYSTLGNAIYLAAVMIFAIFFAIYFIFKKYQNFGKIYRGALAVLLALFALTFFQASTRGAAFGMALAALVSGGLFIFWLPKDYSKYKKLAALFLIAAIIVVAGISYFKNDIPFVKNNGLIYRLFDFSAITNFSSIPRYWSWGSAWQGFLEKPVLGWGPENYASIFNKYFDIRHYQGYFGETWFDRSHNMILDVLNSQGLVGLLAYLAILSSAIFLIFRFVKKNPEKKFIGIWMIGLLAAYFGQNMFVFDTLNTYILFYFLLGFIYSEFEMSRMAANQDADRYKNIRDNPRVNSCLAGRQARQSANVPFLPTFCLFLFIWLFIAWWGNYLPYKSNKYLAMVFRNFGYNFSAAVTYYDAALKINSPFTLFDIQRRTIMPFIEIMQNKRAEPQKIKPQIEKVLAEGERALQSHPWDSQIYWILGDARNRAGVEYNDIKMVDRAEQILKKAREMSPRRPEYINSLAQNYMIKGQYAQAISVLSELSSFAPKVSLPHFMLAKVYVSAGNIDAAVAESDKAAELSHHINYHSVMPSDIRIMASIYRSAKKHDKIIKIYEDLLKESPNNAAYMLELAKAYSDSGDKEKARPIAQYALNIAGSDDKLKPEIEKLLQSIY